jgi:hypothetical protein
MCVVAPPPGLYKHLQMWFMEYCSIVEGCMCLPGCGWGHVFVVGARGERLLGVGVVCMLCSRFCMGYGRSVW